MWSSRSRVRPDVYKRQGVGGLPVGSAGKVVTLLSSGIDSPVATWMLARREMCIRDRLCIYARN